MSAYSAGQCSCLATIFLHCTLGLVYLPMMLLFVTKKMDNTVLSIYTSNFLAHSLEATMFFCFFFTSKEHRHSLRQHQKFRKASILSAELASVTCYASKTQFERRIKLIKDLILYWKNGEVGLAELNESESDHLCVVPSNYCTCIMLISSPSSLPCSCN